MSSHAAAAGRALDTFHFVALPLGPHGPLLLDAARAILDAAGIHARYDLLAAECGECGEAERALVLDADVTILAGEPLASLVASAGAARPAPAEAGGGAAGLARLFAPLDAAIRFQPCRAYAGNPWNQREGIDLIVLGDGGLAAPSRQSREDLMSAAWGYAERHGARGVTLLVDRSVDAAERAALEAHGGVLAARHEGVDFEARECDPRGEAVFARAIAGDGGPHVIVAIGEASDAVFAGAAALAGGAAFVPSARFGEAMAVVEIAAASGGGPPGAPAATPIASAVAAKTICEWVGESGKAARIERALAEALRGGALARLAAGAAPGGAPLREIAEAIRSRI